MVIYVRFVVPYDYGEGVWRFVRSDKIYRVSTGLDLILTEYSEDQFYDLMLSRETNGFAIKNAFDTKRIQKIKEVLEKTVQHANSSGDTSGKIFQSWRALQILGSSKLTQLTEGYTENFLKTHHQPDAGAVDGTDNSICEGEWCPGPDFMRYLQIPSPLADGGHPYFGRQTNYFWPDYLPKNDKRRKLFSTSSFPDFASHFGFLFQVLAGSNSQLMDKINEKNRDLGVLRAFMGLGNVTGD